MRKLLSISLKIMIIFQAIYFTNNLVYYIQLLFKNINVELDIRIIILNYFIPIIFPIILFIFVWIKSEKISEKFINKKKYLLNISYKEILLILVIVLSLYIIISDIILLINNICFLITYKINVLNRLKIIGESSFKADYSINITNIFSIIVEIIFSILFLFYRKKIIKYFENNKKYGRTTYKKTVNALPPSAHQLAKSWRATKKRSRVCAK